MFQVARTVLEDDGTETKVIIVYPKDGGMIVSKADIDDEITFETMNFTSKEAYALYVLLSMTFVAATNPS